MKAVAATSTAVTAVGSLPPLKLSVILASYPPHSPWIAALASAVSLWLKTQGKERKIKWKVTQTYTFAVFTSPLNTAEQGSLTETLILLANLSYYRYIDIRCQSRYNSLSCEVQLLLIPDGQNTSTYSISDVSWLSWPGGGEHWTENGEWSADEALAAARHCTHRQPVSELLTQCAHV